MARNIEQSTQGPSIAATSDNLIHWDMRLEIMLEKFQVPALLQALEVASNLREEHEDQTLNMLEDARVNPHQFTEACFPLDMPAFYDAFVQFDIERSERQIRHPEYNPSVDANIAWLIHSKLWRLCKLSTNQSWLNPATVAEITGICLLAEHATNILNSDARAYAARGPFKLVLTKAGKKAKRLHEEFWKEAEKSFYWKYSRDRWLYSSLEEAAAAMSETEVFPFGFLQCLQMAKKFEEQIKCH